MEKSKILIVEDDTDINHLLHRMLAKSGYDTIQAFSGTEAKLLLQLESPDLMILDLMLPGMTGEELISAVREEMGLNIPILVLSAKAALETKVHTLKSGADDYLTKPFEPEEVLAHVYAALRRYKKETDKKVPEIKEYVYKKLRLCPKSRKVEIEGEELTLTVLEYDILFLLMKEPDKVYSRENLYEMVWKDGYYGEDNTINVHISNLRRKLAAADPEEEYIRTVWGIGFKMA
ncbi:response regulator transcription factor [Muricomes intestini]|jgi:DNA-binding response OmpR family regulator|uniref:Stage 0 sporulation protein A homolog n=1 Tax=Muricomes intestini TaxID=1796634 RepID=A0A4R3KC43_9FIRM|nr:response regulator transcription factor [Muricomes intestini]TCS80648.1 DNA-binding response OmpR family regulator [Muricomes intestini]HAX50832.1 DNA-binding response regulator [Lachnospiraceae bacterium]HCR83141.1 DNA-binding response regulator [Lachnospiraceae bacterium]